MCIPPAPLTVPAVGVVVGFTIADVAGTVTLKVAATPGAG